MCYHARRDPRALILAIDNGAPGAAPDQARHRCQRRGGIGGRAGVDRAAQALCGFRGRNDLTFPR